MEKKLNIAEIEKKIKTAEIISWIIVVLMCIGYGMLSGLVIKMNVWLSICIGFVVGIVIGILRVVITNNIRLKMIKHWVSKNVKSY